MTLGDALLDHYAHFLRDFDRVAKFEVNGTSIQVLDFPHAVADAHVFASLGLSHFQDTLGEVCEVVVPVSSGDDEVCEAVEASLSFLLNLQKSIAEVSYLRHLHRTVPTFFERYGKSAVAFADPSFLFPEKFGGFTLKTSGQPVRLWLGYFLTEAEVQLAERQGFDALEQLLADQGVDVVNLHRSSAI